MVQVGKIFENQKSVPAEVPVEVTVEPSVGNFDQSEPQASLKKVSFNEKVTQHVIEPVSVEIGK